MATKVLSKQEALQALRKDLDTFLSDDLPRLRRNVVRTRRAANIALDELVGGIQALEQLRAEIWIAEMEAETEIAEATKSTQG